jgi:hypothetical protein
LIATVVGRNTRFAQLDPSVGGSGPHAFAVRRLHHSSDDAVFVHRIPQHVRDDREAPLDERDDATILLICISGKAKYFSPGRLTRFRKSRPSGKSVGGARSAGPNWRQAKGRQLMSGTEA